MIDGKNNALAPRQILEALCPFNFQTEKNSKHRSSNRPNGGLENKGGDVEKTRHNGLVSMRPPPLNMNNKNRSRFLVGFIKNAIGANPSSPFILLAFQFLNV